MTLPIAHLLTATASIERWTGHDEDLMPTFAGSITTLACMWTDEVRRVRDGEGDEVISTSNMIVLEEISSLDRIWAPGATTSNIQEARTPIAISRPRSPRGDYITTVFFG